MWEELNDYDLRNLWHHLLNAREWKWYEYSLLQTDFLEEFIIRNGYGQLLDTLGACVPLSMGQESALTNTQNLLEILIRETGSLDGWRRNEKKHSFLDQVNCSARLSDIPLTLNRQAGAQERIEFQVRWKEMQTDETVRILMPGKRRAVGWDIYDAGWMDPHTSIELDLEKDLLRTQTCCTYSLGFSMNEYTYYRRDYALHNGILLKEYPEVVVSEHYPMQSKGPSEILFTQKDQPVTGRSKKWESKIRKHLVAGGLDKKAVIHLDFLASSCNTDQVLVGVSIQEETSNRYRQEPFCRLYDTTANRLSLTSVSQQRNIRFGSTRQMVRLNQQLYLFYTDSNDDLIRIAVSEASPDDPVMEAITASDADPVATSLLLVHSDTVEVRSLPDGARIWHIPLKEGIWSYNILSLLNKEGTQCAIGIGQELTRYSLPGDRSEVVQLEQADKDLVLSRDLEYYVTHRQVYQIGLPTALAAMALDIEIAPDYQKPPGYFSYYNNLYIEKSDYLICVWNGKTGKSIASLCSQLNHWQDVGHLVGFDCSPDEHFIISANDGWEVLVWDLWDLGEKRRIPRYAHWRLNGLHGIRDIQTVLFFNGGFWVVMVTKDQQLYVCTFESDTQILGSIRLHQMPTKVHAPVFSKTVMVVFSDGSLVYYNVCESADGTRVQKEGVLFRLNDQGAATVCIAGSFNAWQRQPMSKADNGWWECLLPLQKGRYEYKYVVDGSNWRLDPLMSARPTPFGFNSYVDV